MLFVKMNVSMSASVCQMISSTKLTKNYSSLKLYKDKGRGDYFRFQKIFFRALSIT